LTPEIVSRPKGRAAASRPNPKQKTKRARQPYHFFYLRKYKPRVTPHCSALMAMETHKQLATNHTETRSFAWLVFFSNPN
jgi:hypothetical protein